MSDTSETPKRIAARSSTGLRNMAAFFVSRAERTNDVCLCVYEVADILKEAADAIKILERERDEARQEAKRATYDAAQETIKVSTVKSHWIEACRERDEAREAAAMWEKVALREASMNGARICGKETVK